MGPGMKGFRPRSVDSTCVFKNNASFVKGIERTESIGRGKLVKNGPLHDSFFKGALGNPEVMAAALRGLLPKEYAEGMDFERLVFLPGESVGEGLGSSRMDLVFSVPLDGKEILLAVIVEHKSRPDPRIHFQLLQYVLSFWNRALRDSHAPRPVLPVLFYHGKEPWNVPPALSELLGTPREIQKGVPDFSLVSIDLASHSDQEILGRVEDLVTTALLLSMKHIFEGPGDVFSSIFKASGKREDLYAILKPVIGLIFNYVAGFHGLTDPGMMRQILTPIILEANMPDIMDMIIEEGIQKGREEGIQKGREEGIRKGREEGIREGREEMIRTLLVHGVLTPEKIASMFEIDLEHLRKISEK